MSALTDARYRPLTEAMHVLISHGEVAMAAHDRYGPDSECEAQRLDAFVGAALQVALLAQALAYNGPADRRFAEVTVLDALLALVAPEFPVGIVDSSLDSARMLVERALNELTLPEAARG